MCICSGCGKLIDSKFCYCPWCGYSRIKQEQADSLELRFQHFKAKQMEERASHLEEMEKQLDDLEEELNVLVLSAQMAK